MSLVVTASPGSLPSTLDAIGADEFALLLAVRDLRELRASNSSLARYESTLVRSCVGVAVVSADRFVRSVVIQRARSAPFPLTSLADEDAAEGWLRGQLAAGIRATRRPGGRRTVGVTLELDEYIEAHSSRGDDVVATELTRRTAERFGQAAVSMNVGAAQGGLLQLLVEVTRASVVAEIGTFTGMSALWLARGLPAGGTLTCFENWTEPLELALEAWAAAGVDDRIEVVVGPALESLNAMPDDWVVDLAFVDADKQGYTSYVDALLRHLTPEGLIVVDNTLWGGAVVDCDTIDRDAIAVREFNASIRGRTDLDVTVLPVGDGVTLVRKRATVQIDRPTR